MEKPYTATAIKMIHALKNGPKKSRELADILHCGQGTPQYVFSKNKKIFDRKKEGVELVFSLKKGFDFSKVPSPEDLNKQIEEKMKIGETNPLIYKAVRLVDNLRDTLLQLNKDVIPSRGRAKLQKLIQSGILD